jgi:amidohydrolase
MRSFTAEVEALREQMITWRRDFHQHPELAFEEIRTSNIVADHLSNLGMEVQRGVGQTGVIGVLEGAHDGPTVLVRADMDALPIHEANQTPYVSTVPNHMHACGHDAHTSIAMTVAQILADRREHLAGRVKFIFQPAEEIGAGAKAMIEDGALENPAADVAVGLHVWNNLPVGQIAVTDGPAMAGARSFHITIKGRGGHAAVPNQTRDPVMAAAHIMTMAQTIVSRNVDPMQGAVVSFTQMDGGDAFNVIPDEVKLTGTIRVFEDDVLDMVVDRFETIVDQVAMAMQCQSEITYRHVLPPLVNNPGVAQRLRDGFRSINSDVQIVDDLRTMGSEDMGRFLAAVPGVYFFVGSANSEQGLDFPHHHPQFDIDERALVIGASLLTSAVADYVWNT